MKKLMLFLAISLIQSATYGQDLLRNPLKIDNFPLYYQAFSIASKGTLTLELNETNSNKVPFKVYLRRDNKVVNIGASSDKKVVSQIEVSEVLKHSKYGDFLIVEPADKSKQNQARWIQIRNLLFDYFNLNKNANNSGC